MGSLPPIKRFLADDYPKEEQSWINTLLYPLNLLLNTIYSNLNNGLTIGQNMQAQLNTLPVTGASPTTSYQWKFSTAGAPAAVLIGNVVQTNGTSQPITQAVTCSWSYNAGIVSINNVTGLTKGNSYNVTFMTFIG